VAVRCSCAGSEGAADFLTLDEAQQEDVMELVEGEIADALTAADSHGIVHRDLSRRT
jgi:hypothetical protein